MILNQMETWRDTPGWVHQAFKGNADKVTLREGFRIYKFNSYPSLQPPGAPEWGKITPWWSPLDAFEWDAGLENRRKTAAAMGGASLKELSRIVVAVREDWSSLDYLVKATLTKPVFAFFGVVAPQARIGPGAKSMRRDNERQSRGGGKLIGLGSQFYIPNLRMAHLTDIEAVKL